MAKIHFDFRRGGLFLGGGAERFGFSTASNCDGAGDAAGEWSKIKIFLDNRSSGNGTSGVGIKFTTSTGTFEGVFTR